MNAGIIGADPQALRDMAAKFDAAAQELTGTKSSVQMWVDRSDIWRGLDNQNFVSNWNSTGARFVMEVTVALRRNADILRANADAQDSVSAADGASPGGSGLFDGGGTRPKMSPAGQPDPDDPQFWREFLTTAGDLMDHEAVHRITVGELTSLLGGIGLSAGRGAALDLALAAPGLVTELLDPNVPLGTSLNSVIALATDMAGGGLFALGVKNGNPTVMLLGTAYMSVGLAMEAANDADFSPSGFETTWNYARENPGVVVEEIGKATIQVFGDLGKKIGSAFIGGKLGV